MGNSADFELVTRILNGEKHLFHDLIRPCERAAYLTAYGVLKNEADAEDVTQEAILKSYRALATFRGESKFSTWLLSIVLNEARGRLRQLHRYTVESLDAAPENEEEFAPYVIADWREIPSEVLEREELTKKIEKAIENLAPAYREVFLLRDKEERSIDEIARIVGVSTGLVKVRLFRARMLLQKQLTPYLKRETAAPKRFFSWLGGRP